jgi:hypothetical protein
MGFLWHRGVRPRAGTWLFANYFEADVDFGFGMMAASSYRGQSAVLKRKAVGRSTSFSEGAKIAVLRYKEELAEINRITFEQSPC